MNRILTESDASEQISNTSEQGGPQTLDADQRRFLAERLLTSSDAAACRKINISRTILWSWKKDCPAFMEAYNALGTDGIELAKSIIRNGLSKAANVLLGCLDSENEETRRKSSVDLLNYYLAKQNDYNLRDPDQLAATLGRVWNNSQGGGG